MDCIECRPILSLPLSLSFSALHRIDLVSLSEWLGGKTFSLFRRKKKTKEREQEKEKEEEEGGGESPLSRMG